MGQESILADARYSSVSVLNLGDQKLTQFIPSGYIDWSIVVGRNRRLALVSAADYLSVVDLTIGREITRVEGIGYGRAALSSDGKRLLIADNTSLTLDVIDVATLKLIKRIDLTAALGAGACDQCFAAVVVVGTQVYVTTIFTDTVNPAIAVVDLNASKATAIPIPAGFLDGSSSFLTPDAGATADAKYVVMVETYLSDFSYHVLYISTATNTVVEDYQITTDPYGILLNPAPNSQYAYILGSSVNFLFSATVFDLQTGQLLPKTEVELDTFFVSSSTAAINPQGTRLVVGGELDGQTKPNPNLVVVDTTKMLNDSSHAVVGHATIAHGVRPYGTTIASIKTTPPATAPTVTNIHPAVVNNSIANVVHISGTNFAPGAQVRIGTMPPLKATALDSNHLKVTIPKDAPAQDKVDVVVTNPNVNGPPADTYQSGLLAEAFSIKINPAFHPKNRFASFSVADWNVAVYDFAKKQMVGHPTFLVSYSMAFNVDGAEVYSVSPGTQGLISSPQLLDYDPANGVLQADVSLGIPYIGEYLTQSKTASSVNPATGNPVLYVPITTQAPGTMGDIAVQMIDTKHGSPTFNQVINTFYAGLNTYEDIWAGAASTPDGRYVYVNFDENFDSSFDYAIFDTVQNSVTVLDANTLGAASIPDEIYVTPDGQSLLLNDPNYSLAVFDISGANATNPKLITTIRAGNATFQSWQVVGDRLFTLVYPGKVIVYRFDPAHSNFKKLASYTLPTPSAYTLAVSPDGELVYVTMTDYDQIMVLDAHQLLAHAPPLLTAIGTPRAPFKVSISPRPGTR